MSSAQHQQAALILLPPELTLQIITYIPHNPRDLRAIRSTSRYFYSLLTTHETTLVTAIRRTSYRTTPLLFPSLPLKSYDQLTALYARLVTLADLHASWLYLTSHSPELNWLRNRWESIHKAGILLLYRLQDCGDVSVNSSSDATHSSKVDLINLLPATSLACLIFKCYSAIKILRVHGPEPALVAFAKDDTGARREIELALKEMLLTHGVEFFMAMLQAGRGDSGRGRWAVDVLNVELFNPKFRQLHSEASTLIQSLRRSFAQKTSGHIDNTAIKMWEVLSSSVFDEVDEEKMVKIVRGEALIGGMKRMGY